MLLDREIAMAPRIGYLLPTREQTMAGRPEAVPLLQLAERAGGLGFNSIWVGNSLLARPRHDPLTLLAAVAARVPRVELGTAVLLPALRNPVVLAQQVATLDQISEGRVILGVGIASDMPNIRSEFVAAGVPFEKRVGRLLEGMQLCRALWTGKPVSWDGRWKVEGALGPTPHRPGGPPWWIAGALPASLERAGRHFDGWIPNGPDAKRWGEQWAEIQGDRAHRWPRSEHVDRFDVPDGRHRRRTRAARTPSSPPTSSSTTASRRRRCGPRQQCYGGPLRALRTGCDGYAEAGASHLILRFAGDHERHLETLPAIRAKLGW